MTLRERIGAALLTACLALPGVAGGSEGTTDWSFRVLLDGREIGTHRFELDRAGQRTRLSSEASFDVKFLFVTVFKYRHEATETWEDDCLVELSAETDSNGKALAVSGERRGDAFALDVPADEPPIGKACVQTFAYWNRGILDAEALLNTQTGEYEEVEIERIGADTVELGDFDVAAERYRIGTRAGDISLWYAADSGRWLALEAPAKGGRTLRYEPSDPGRALGDGQRLASMN
ncbi:MAG: DUF6134 family protein [Pseudomonadota bacterium]